MTTNPDSFANQVRVVCANTLSAETLAQVTGSRSARVTLVDTDGNETTSTYERELNAWNRDELARPMLAARDEVRDLVDAEQNARQALAYVAKARANAEARYQAALATYKAVTAVAK